MTNGPTLVKKYSKMDSKMVPSLHQASDCLVFLLNPFSEWFKKLRKHLPKSQPSSFSSFNQKMGKLLNFCKLSMLPELFSLHNSYFFAIILIGK